MTNDTAEHWAAQNETYNFISFAAAEAYRAVNRTLIARALAELPARFFFHVDVASGTGLVPQEVSALCAAQGRQATVIGLDPDRFALESARRATPTGPHCTVEFVQGVAQEMPRLLAGKLPAAGADYTSIHDALHEIQSEADKRAVLRAMADLLRPGGVFTYNSAFTTCAMEEAPLEWGRLKAKGLAILGGKRDRKAAAAFKVHTPEEFRQMITDAGLTVIHEARQVVRIPRAAMDAIGRYPAFIEGAFSDMIGTEQVPLAEKSRAILAAIDAMGLVEIPRVWHEIVARK